MAKNKVDELVVEIKGDVTDLLRKLDVATDSTASAGKRMAASFGVVSSGVGAVSKGLGSFGLAVEGAKAAMAPFISMLDKMSSTAGILKTARQVGLSVEKFQELSFAAKSVGIDSETMADAVKDLSVKITDAAGGATAYEEALNKVGLKSKELVNLPVDEQFRRFADAMANASDANRRFVADEINDSMFQLNDLLSEGSEGLDRFAQEARELNAVLSEVELKRIALANKEFEKLKAGFDSLLNEVIVALSPAMAEFLSGTVKGLKEINKWLELGVTNSDKLANAEKRLAELNELIDNTEQSRKKNALIKQRLGLYRELKDLRRAVYEEEQATGPIQGPQNFNLENDELSRQFGLTADGKKEGPKEGEEEVDEEEKKKNLDMGYGVYGPDDFEDLMARNFEQFEALENQRKEFLDRELNQYKDQIRQTQWLWESGAQGKLRVTKGFFNDLLTITQGRSRKLFEFNKALGIADATISTFKGAAKALELPYPYNLVAMAQVAASGMAQVSKIQSVQFGGGGGGSSSGGASAPASASSEALQSAEQQGPTNITEATINITGDNISGDSARALVAQLREYQEDGGELLIK